MCHTHTNIKVYKVCIMYKVLINLYTYASLHIMTLINNLFINLYTYLLHDDSTKRFDSPESQKIPVGN